MPVLPAPSGHSRLVFLLHHKMVQFAAGIAEIDFAEANNVLPILRNGDERAFPREGIRKEL